LDVEQRLWAGHRWASRFVADTVVVSSAGDNRHRTRDRGLSLGHRPGGRAARNSVTTVQLKAMLEIQISFDWHLLFRRAGGRTSVGNPQANCVADEPSSTPAGRSRQPRTNTRKCGDQPAHQSLLNRRLDGPVSSPAQPLCLASPRSSAGDCTAAPGIIDNEHQSSRCGLRCRSTGASRPPTCRPS
jgi:hypothetical protein